MSSVSSATWTICESRVRKCAPVSTPAGVLEAALGTLRDNPDAYRAPVDDDECDEPAVAAS